MSTIALMTAGVWVISSMQYRQFYNELPLRVRDELIELNAQDMDDSPRVKQIYHQYWRGDALFGEKLTVLLGLVVCLPFGLGVGFWASRYVTRPLASIIEVAHRVEHGDLSTRAIAKGAHGEMGEVVQTFNMMVDSLQKLEAERQATAASISHELRTPLAVLTAHLHAVCDGVIEFDAATGQTLLNQTEHLKRLVDDLHTLSMAEAGQLSLHIQQLNVCTLVHEILVQMQPQLTQFGMKVELDLGEVDSLTDVRADPDRMRQIIANLVSNAIRHASCGHWVGISVRAEDDGDRRWVRLQVRDAGPGLPLELVHHPFQRFAQSPGKRRRDGSGLGLSIVRVLTELQGGASKSTAYPMKVFASHCNLRWPSCSTLIDSCQSKHCNSRAMHWISTQHAWSGVARRCRNFWVQVSEFERSMIRERSIAGQ